MGSVHHLSTSLKPCTACCSGVSIQNMQNTRDIHGHRRSILSLSLEMLPCHFWRHAASRVLFPLVTSLLIQRRQASGHLSRKKGLVGGKAATPRGPLQICSKSFCMILQLVERQHHCIPLGHLLQVILLYRCKCGSGLFCLSACMLLLRVIPPPVPLLLACRLEHSMETPAACCG